MNHPKLQKFGPTAQAIYLSACRTPQNPYNYFGRSMRRSWSYAYFYRLYRAGLLERTDAPMGRRGYHWYVAVRP